MGEIFSSFILGRRMAATSDLSLDPIDRAVLNIARYFFHNFAKPDSQAWIEGFATADRLFPAPYGAALGHAVLSMVLELRRSRLDVFDYLAPDSPEAQCALTDEEKYFVSAFKATRACNRTGAETHAMLLCQGNGTEAFLSSCSRLSLLLGDGS